MDIITWDLILKNVLPTFILLALIISMGGILASLIVPAFKVRRGLFAVGLLMLLLMVFLAMVALSIISVRFPTFFQF